MSLNSSNKVDTNRYQLNISVDPEEFEKAVEKTYKKEVGKIAIPGFRKGKAPRNFIEKYYGKEIFYDGAINIVYPKALDDAVKEAELDVIDDKIDFDIVEVGKDGLTFKATLTVKPEVKIENYKGIEVKNINVNVTEEDINDEIEKIRQRNSRLITIEDREAQNGDIAVIDFEGFCDGTAFEGGKAEKYSLGLGDGHFIKGFEDQVIGHKSGDEFDINVTFPEDYQAKDLAGKDAVFKIKLHEIKKKELPEVDDEFVKDVSEFDTLDQYKEDIKNKLTEKFETKAKDDADNQMIDKIIELLQADIPEAMFNNKIKELVNEFGYRLQSQGMNINSYMQYTGMDNDKLRESFRPQAERQVKTRLALEQIAKLENLEATEEDIENRYKELSEQYNIEIEKIKHIILKSDLEQDVKVEKAVNFVRDNTIAVYVHNFWSNMYLLIYFLVGCNF